ncbi:MAG: DegT/DnrJ/EryC1/StrS family aminotransferase [Calditrichaeota bacterium]|nr:DegT/DnrJ/EryC1/StrS family aminotransferase [Calditrichota bacterium]
MPAKNIFVTQPNLPDLEKFVSHLEKIWESKYLTNKGIYHQEFESKLSEFLGVKYCTLLSNGTLALLIGLKALKLTGEVITTPYSFVATSHSILWNNQTPVFCDIDPANFNIDPDKIEPLITSETSAILATHTYGFPCVIEKISDIAAKHNLKVIYDAAHAFAVEKNGTSILTSGDLSILSFHSTKVFNTIEGGAIVTNNEDIKKQADLWRNFGIANEETVLLPGINAKMNELQSAYGLLQLEIVEQEIANRKAITELYREKLADISGLKLFYDLPGVKHNYSYFPVLVDANEFGLSRNEVYDILRKKNIYARKYFYPLISSLPDYKKLPTASAEHLPVSNKIAGQVLCLPLFGALDLKDVEQISKILMQMR